MRCAAWSVLFNFLFEEILLKQIIEIFWAVLPDCFFLSCPNLERNCSPYLVRQCYQSTCLFWKICKK